MESATEKGKGLKKYLKKKDKRRYVRRGKPELPATRRQGPRLKARFCGSDALHDLSPWTSVSQSVKR